MELEIITPEEEKYNIVIDLALLTAKDNIKYRKEILEQFKETNKEGLKINLEVSLNLIHLAKLDIDPSKWPEIIKKSMIKHLGELSDLLEIEENNSNVENIKKNLQLSVNIPRNQNYISANNESKEIAEKNIQEIVKIACENGFTKLNITTIDGNPSAEIAVNKQGTKNEIIDSEKNDLFWYELIYNETNKLKEKYPDLNTGMIIGSYFNGVKCNVFKRTGKILEGAEKESIETEIARLQNIIEKYGENINAISTQMPLGSGKQYADYVSELLKLEGDFHIAPGIAMNTTHGLFMAVVRTQVAQVVNQIEGTENIVDKIKKSKNSGELIRHYIKSGFSNLKILSKLALEPINQDLLARFIFSINLEELKEKDKIMYGIVKILRKFYKSGDYNPEEFINDFFDELEEKIKNGDLTIEQFKKLKTIHLNPNGQSPIEVGDFSILIAKRYDEIINKICSKK